jgi:hypothetical protein
MPFRFPTSIPKTLTEMWERLRECVRQLEPVILKNVAIGTTETAVAHGLGERPAWFGWDPPHCIAIVRQTRDPDQKCVYLRATNPCLIDLKFVRGGPFKASNGRHDLADWDPAGSALGDHKVATDSADEAASGAGYLLAKHSNNGNVKFSLDSSSGRRVRGDVEFPTPEVEGAYLYAARLPDQYLRTPVRALQQWGQGYGCDWSQWTQISGGFGTYVWRANRVGAIQLYPLGGMVPAVGDRVLCLLGLDPGASPYDGVYEILDPGSATTPAIIRRALDCNTAATFCPGMIVQVSDPDAGFYGTYWRVTSAGAIDVATPEFENVETYTPAYTYALLTAAQLTTEGATSETVQEDVTMADGEAELENGHYTLVGVPGVSAIPAGPITFELENVLLDTADPDYLTRAKVRLLDIDRQGDGVVIASGYSQPITWGLAQQQTARNISFQVNLAADYEFNPTHGLGLLVGISTNSPTPVTLMLWINSPDHGTRVKIPGLEFPVVGGTNWHPDQLGRSEPDQHPYSALEPVGLARVPFVGAALAAADSGGANGKLALGDSNRQLVSPAGFDLTQIQTPTVPSGASVEKELVFSAAVKLQHDVTPDAGFSSLYLHRAGSIKNPVWFKYANSVARFLYVPSLSAWKLMSMHDTT